MTMRSRKHRFRVKNLNSDGIFSLFACFFCVFRHLLSPGMGKQKGPPLGDPGSAGSRGADNVRVAACRQRPRVRSPPGNIFLAFVGPESGDSCVHGSGRTPFALPTCHSTARESTRDALGRGGHGSWRIAEIRAAARASNPGMSALPGTASTWHVYVDRCVGRVACIRKEPSESAFSTDQDPGVRRACIVPVTSGARSRTRRACRPPGGSPPVAATAGRRSVGRFWPLSRSRRR